MPEPLLAADAGPSLEGVWQRGAGAFIGAPEDRQRLPVAADRTLAVALAPGDVAVVRGHPRDFLSRLPAPADVVLVVEVAHSSLVMDRRKAGVYAKAGYDTYWLVDVEARRLEVRNGLTADGLYTKTEIFSDDAEVALPSTSALVRVADLLP